ncbi:MAG: F-type H+-transporting ATPase subunit b [Bryobacterales bacterium]|jgi:F0F1-type ATP synthase membrane subunit b/b'|nr:F-type H+-transporting ATPase subunit b [Bryobacterales bacterium]
MDQTLHALGGIVLNGLPTFFLIIILAICVKYLYLKPLDKVLAERFRLTEGARKAAEESLRNADTKVAEYEAALAQARSEIYREQAEFLKHLQDEQSGQVRAARVESDARVAEAKAAIAREAQTAQQSLEVQSETLAGQIADAILARRAA